MHINVRDFLAESVGYNQAYKISGERPQLEGVVLTQDVEGEITVSRLDSSLLVRGQLHTEVQLECHRCLRTFTRPASFTFYQEYAETPEDDQMPITDGEIDLAPVVGQEIILGLPIKVLDRPDCPGLPEAAGKYTNKEETSRLADRARITKGSKRGRS
jgi:uncharacterized metal-binding protein YceD (DUF177 family)